MAEFLQVVFAAKLCVLQLLVSGAHHEFAPEFQPCQIVELNRGMLEVECSGHLSPAYNYVDRWFVVSEVNGVSTVECGGERGVE